MEYKTLIQKLENLKQDFYDNMPEFFPVLHNIYLKNNAKAAKELTDSLAKYLVKIHEYKDGYTEAFCKAQDKLDYYSEIADEEYSLKASDEKIGDIQNFYRTAVNYEKEDLFRLN